MPLTKDQGLLVYVRFGLKWFATFARTTSWARKTLISKLFFFLIYINCLVLAAAFSKCIKSKPLCLGVAWFGWLRGKHTFILGFAWLKNCSQFWRAHSFRQQNPSTHQFWVLLVKKMQPILANTHFWQTNPKHASILDFAWLKNCNHYGWACSFAQENPSTHRFWILGFGLSF